MELMQAIQNIHFLRPWLLWLLPPVLLALWWLGRRFRRRDGWSAVVDAHLLPAIRVQQGGKASGLLKLAVPVFAIGIIALAGPAWQKKTLPVIKNQHALVIALDLSRSMLATDIKPNRLQRAKFKVEDLLNQRKDGQTALVAWAGEAFVVTPLTDDSKTIAAMLDALDPSIMPRQGSRADKALEKAAELIEQAGLPRGDILLIADGVNNPAAEEKAAELARRGFRVHVLGVGTAEGAPIPTRSGFFTDRRGNIVIPKLDEAALRAVAASGNGRYHHLSADDSDLQTIVEAAAGDTLADENRDGERSEQWLDGGIWLLFLLLPLMALMYRRGWLLTVVLVVGLHGNSGLVMAQEAAPIREENPTTSEKSDTSSERWRRLWDNLWYNKNQQAARALRSGQAQQAVEMARDPRWKAAAEYKSGQYQAAEKAWQSLQNPTADDWYNRGNALARAGRLQEAIKAYEQALALQPEHADALHNKKIVEEALKRQQEQQGQQSQQDQQGDQNQQNQQGQQDQQSQQGEQSDQGQQKDQQDQQGDQNQQNQQGQQDQQNQQGEQSNQGQQKDQQEQPTGSGNSDGESSQDPSQTEDEQQRQAQAMEEAQRQAEEKARQAMAQQENGEVQDKQEQEALMPKPAESAEEAEQQQAMEQWLRRVPDDPGGLLRRKFQYQYRQRQLNRQVDKNETEQDW